jgi:Xaa-Pro aminopeptidase
MSHPNRFIRLRAGLTQRGCDGAILTGPSHAVHLAGYRREHSGPTALVFTADGHRTLVVPAYERDAAERTSTADAVVAFGDATMGLEPAPADGLVAAAAGLVRSRRIGVAGDQPGLAEAVADRAGAEPVSIADLVADVREVKDHDELAHIARTYRLCVAAQDAVSEAAGEGVSEIELLTRAHAAVQLGAGRPVGFGGDLVAGDRTSLVGGPAAVAGRTRLRADDVVLADVFAEVDGYWAATGRTTIVGAYPDADAARGSMLELRDEVAAALRPGVTPCELYARLAAGVAARHPEGRFPHHGGHGVGVSAYEAPYVRPAGDRPLRVGNVVTLEPGVYFPGRFGARCETTYVVTADGGRDVAEFGTEEVA